MKIELIGIALEKFKSLLMVEWMLKQIKKGRSDLRYLYSGAVEHESTACDLILSLSRLRPNDPPEHELMKSKHATYSLVT